MDRPESSYAMGGAWESITSCFSYLLVHMAVLPTGKVLGFGGSGNQPRSEFVDASVVARHGWQLHPRSSRNLLTSRLLEQQDCGAESQPLLGA
jgi:hypothetical protein